ncbi:hypothetical protein E1A91_D09G211000v1 [Gossypium mustelinum]|uniref:Uncharacterized protein n=1 Tax=Gossypium mustelinum TaxID=34275 RepID=A0A5D2TME1_GOSMU|nr:hypothetical protein E1A91_D09G211000v1 [Gossypium mustelinum]
MGRASFYSIAFFSKLRISRVAVTRVHFSFFGNQ